MPRVTYVKKARKDNPAVKKGESYYWWKFRYGGKRYSASPPRPSQLTQSPYYSTVRSLIEQVEDYDVADNDDFTSLRDEIAAELGGLRDECQESLDNMPDSLQYSPTGELLQERIDACDNAEMEVEGVLEFDEEEPDEADFDQECPDCDGSGMNPDYDEEEDEEEDEQCGTCGGTGEGVIDEGEKYDEALAEWQEKLADWSTQAKDEIIEAIGNCEV